MKETLEELEQFAIDVILNRRRGTRASVLRFFLSGLSRVYAKIVWFRLFLYRNRILRERNLGCLVVSIGNLTVGGTGKTPVVEKFARSLQDGGRRVAILSRGYKSVKKPLVKRMRKWLIRKNTVVRKRPPLESRTREMLRQAFAGDIEKLGILLQRDLSHWK